MLGERRWDDPLQTHVEPTMGMDMPCHIAGQYLDHWHRMQSGFVAGALSATHSFAYGSRRGSVSLQSRCSSAQRSF